MTKFIAKISKFKFTTWISGLVIGVIFFTLSFSTMAHYGVDWDTINHLPRGQAYLNYYLTKNLTYNNLPPRNIYYQKDDTLFFSPNKQVNRRSFYQIDDYSADYYLNNDTGHPPLSDIISSLFNFIFFQKMGIINDIDSYHIYPLLLASILVGGLYIWVSKEFGIFTAIITVLSLVTYPLFLGESHFNLKDIPETVFFSFALIFFYYGVTKIKKIWILLSATLFGLALGTKFNIIFAVPIMIIWLAIYILFRKISIKKYLKLTPAILLYPLIALAILFISWPFLWKSPIARFIQVINFYKSLGISSDFDQRFIHLGLNTYASEWILYTTPIITIILASIGIFYILRSGLKKKLFAEIFVLLWFLIPIVRVTVPHAGIYGGVRQIMEFIPALAILSGIGATKLVNKTRKLLFLSQLLIILSFIPITAKLISIHPNENVYFNPLIGGLKGAQERDFPYWGNTFGNAYRQAIQWINSNIPPNSTLVLSQEIMTNLPSLWVRSDLTYTNIERSGYLKYGEYVIGLNSGTPFNEIYYSSRYYNRTLNPIYQIKVDDTSILNIWKNDTEHTRKNYLHEAQLTDVNYQITEEGLLFDLKKKLFISRIEWQFSQENCSPLTLGYFRVSANGKNWIYTPHNLPEEFPIRKLNRQPDGNTISYPFGSEYAQYIFFHIEPKDACVKQVLQNSVYFYPDAKETNLDTNLQAEL